MEFGTIERELFIEASPEVVFDVVSSAEHVREWWPDDARFESVPGDAGEIVFGEHGGERTVVSLTVVEVQPPELFSFRWTHPQGEPAREGNSLLVTFRLTPARGGTLLRMTESGFREMGWNAALLEQQYHEHVTGWDYYLPRIAPCADKLRDRS
jgi:uncharacterized protein YndB with AHSA1/START domain